MRRTAIALLAATAITLLAGCGSNSPRPQPKFPDPTPPGTQLAYATTYGYTILNGSHQSISSQHEALALTRNRSVSFTCRKGLPQHRVSISQQLAVHWRQLLTRAKLRSLPSDDPTKRPTAYPELWFQLDTHIVYIQPGRHQHQAACRGTACLAAVLPDATLRALTPSWKAFADFLRPRCTPHPNR